MMHRRGLIKAAAMVGGGSLLRPQPAHGADASVAPPKIIDTNISLFQWPFRRLPLDDTEALVSKLRELGITEAWAGSFEGLLHRDIAAVNHRLAAACERFEELVPIGSVNPELPGWEEDLRRCIDDDNMPGIRLHPSYHGYTLADPRFGRLLQTAATAGRLVQIVVAMEDTRTQHPKMQVPDVDLTMLPDRLRAIAGAKVQILNDRPRGALLEKLAATSGVYFDTARVDGTDGIATLMRNVPQGRVMFSTHAPFLIPEAALIRTHESDLSETELDSLLWAAAQEVRGAEVS